MIFINSPLSQFEVTNLIGIFSPILGKINIILTNLALYTYSSIAGFYFSLDISFLVVIFIGILFCGIIQLVLTHIHYSGRKIIDAIVRNGGTIGAGVVGAVTGLDSAFNLADRMKNKSGGSNGSGSNESDPNKDKDKDKKEENNKDNTNKEQEKNDTKS